MKGTTMPNWVFNYLTVSGEPEKVAQVKEQVGRPIYYNFEDGKVFHENPIFSFWNITAPTDLEAYSNQPVLGDLPTSDPNWWSQLQEKSKTDDSWYNWNHRNWGVKWDVAGDSSIEEETPESVTYRFDTPWGTPDQALITLSSQHPDVTFLLCYEEETGWGGDTKFINGTAEELDEWDWKCRNCDYHVTDTQVSVWCDTCDNTICPFCKYGAQESCSTHGVAVTS